MDTEFDGIRQKQLTPNNVRLSVHPFSLRCQHFSCFLPLSLSTKDQESRTFNYYSRYFFQIKGLLQEGKQSKIKSSDLPTVKESENS